MPYYLENQYLNFVKVKELTYRNNRSLNDKIDPTAIENITVGSKFNMNYFFNVEYKLSGKSGTQGINFFKSSKFLFSNSESLSKIYAKYLYTTKPLALAVSTML